MKKDINIQTLFKKLTEEIEESSHEKIMISIEDEKVNDLFINQFGGDVDFLHDGPKVYYVINHRDYEEFIDYVSSLQLNPASIKIHANFGENVTGAGEAYLPAMNMPSKKQNPHKETTDLYESILSGYEELKGFRAGHTPDKGGFQYKDLWDLNEINPLYKKTTNNVDELKRVRGLLAKAHEENSYSVMSSYEFRIDALRLLVALEKKYNTALPFLQFGMDFMSYLNKYFPGFTGKFGPYNQKWSAVKDHIEQSLSQNDSMNENYSRFKKETKVRSGADQYHQAVKLVRKKVQEIAKLHSYMERMQQELSETQEGLKKKKYTEMAIDKIKNEVKELNKKIRKLK